MIENETIRFRHLLHDVGRNDYHGNFYTNFDYTRSSQKEMERERVLEFVLDTRRDDERRIKMLSLPGLSWAFEHALLVERPNSHLVCLENSVSIYNKSKAFLPNCRGLAIQDRKFQYGNSEINYAIAHKGNGSGRHKSHRFVLMDSCAYATLFSTDYGVRDRFTKYQAARKFYRRNAVWLDFTGTISDAVTITLSNLLLCLDGANNGTKPIVVTVCNARDGLRGENKRVEKLQQAQPALNYITHWTYTGKGGVSMLTACFTVD